MKFFNIFIGFITIFILSSIRLASLPEFRLNSSVFILKDKFEKYLLIYVNLLGRQ